jgi:endonuclease/exonuclease/phosphatase (EEP) superfamily protein YafD
MNTNATDSLKSPSTTRWFLRFLERGLLLVAGSLGLGIWLVLFFSMGSDLLPVFELASHFSCHALIGCFCLLTSQGFFYLIRRNSATSRDRWRRRLIFVLIPLVYFVWVVAPWRLLPLASDKNVNDKIKILIWNVLLHNEDSTEIMKFVEREKPDIVALIEVNPKMDQELDKLKVQYPAWKSNAAWNSGGMVVLSRLPESSFTVLYPGNHWMPAIELSHQRSGESQPLRILTVHTVSPKPIEGNRTLDRNRQLDSIAEWANEQNNPAVIVGDFNVSPWSPSFSQLMKKARLIDSSWYRGYLPSFPASLGMFGIPIDHVLANDQVEFLSRRNLYETHNSDHCPVIVEVRPKK